MTRTLLAVLAAALLGGSSALALDVGDTAPAIQVKTWVANKPVTLEAAKGKVLVVEFWATWCQPCRRTIPHINKLHKKYGDKDVVFVGITEEDEATVKKYMETMAMDYHVGLDDAGKTNNAYMKGVAGIPHAFVVDRDGKVAWHGHPLTKMAQVIEELVAGKFDAARAKKLAALQQKLGDAARTRDQERVMEVVNEIIREVPDDPDAYRLKRAILRDQGKLEETWPVLLDMAKGCAKDPEALIEVALTLSTAGDLEHRDLPKALELAKQAAALSDAKAVGVLAALARVHYELGHVALAAETAAKAAAEAEGEDKTRLEAQVAFYRKELERRRQDPDAK
ncbi:MAG TPA: TlpA disulfide reductase family protein [Planctomycetota bacterium]|nr:TlpA disulfide reductase family protein [Planctomycetota bacterium]HRR80564.1 TlpA disulfide reductase family protein [Planctomycetota bacterium]HRT96245.1 TlpA disulfide reductase family protein [Planctomycetota bacterium]